VRRVKSSSADAIVDGYVPTADTMRAFERLDVLVCGRCQSVFHLVDEFRSVLKRVKSRELRIKLSLRIAFYAARAYCRAMYKCLPVFL
jgi:hypothetical protein